MNELRQRVLDLGQRAEYLKGAERHQALKELGILRNELLTLEIQARAKTTEKTTENKTTDNKTTEKKPRE